MAPVVRPAGPVVAEVYAVSLQLGAAVHRDAQPQYILVLTLAAGKTVKREVKVLKAKCTDESSVMSFDAQNAEWQGA
jgi:Na+/serine symporter